MNFLRVLVFFSMAMSASAGLAGHRTLRVSYMPFDMETFVPVTMANIENVSPCKFSLGLEDSRVKAIFSVISPVSTKGIRLFDSDSIRLKVDGLNGRVIYIDKYGSYLVEGEALGGKIPDGLFFSFKSNVEQLAVSEGCADTGVDSSISGKMKIPPLDKN